MKPFRDTNRRERRRTFWWQHGETVPGIRKAVAGLKRAIFTPRVAKHRLFVWAPPVVVPDSRVVIVCRDDDVTFGILHSRFHELWSLALGGWHGVGNDPQYTPSLGFETFPFPGLLTPDVPVAQYARHPHAAAIATAAERLDRLRRNWLNPDDLAALDPEIVTGFPDRIVPRSETAMMELGERTLTNLYNRPPQWLLDAHAALDVAVADAYGWGDDWRAGRLGDDEILGRLFTLNRARTGG